jgi:porphobilinogen synthase
MPTKSPFPTIRLRRLRQHPQLRSLLRETELTINDLVLPLFIRHGEKIKNPIASMPGHHQLSVDQLPAEIAEINKLKIPAVLLFGIPAHKDAIGSASYDDNGVVQKAIAVIKKNAPNLLVIADACFCEYTDHGHCGVIHEINNHKDIDNDATLELLTKQAVSFAKAGADVIAPSGMIDGMVQAIRSGLDNAGFTHIPILSYSSKYASAMYGPFREAAEGAPQFGDRNTYQMDIANSAEAMRETALDVLEGADILMVKPAHTYLDVIYRVKQAYPEIPLAAYHVSGEFAMLKAAAQQGWLDEKKAVLEVLTAIKRAGADFIITYYAKELAQWLQT